MDKFNVSDIPRNSLIRRLHREGRTYQSLAVEFGISAARVRQIDFGYRDAVRYEATLLMRVAVNALDRVNRLNSFRVPRGTDS